MARRTSAVALLFTAIIAIASSAPSDRKDAVNTYDPEFGVYIGQLSSTTSNSADTSISGRAYVVNETTLQIVDFTFVGKANDAYFWLSTPFGKDVLKLPTFEFGFTPLGNIEEARRIVLNLPNGRRVSEFKSVSVYSPSEKFAYASVAIPDNLVTPKSHFLPNELSGSRYNIRSGPILVLDSRTIKIFAFTFDGDKAPDGYFFVGRGLNVAHDAGVKVPIRGRDTPDSITPMNEKYRGGQDIILDLPADYDVYHIDFLSVYCYKFRVDFAHVAIGNLPSNIPPYVPLPHGRSGTTGCENPWKPQPLLGTAARTNFTLQLGPAGGACGYRAITGLRAPDFVWYVNGYLAELYLKRGTTYKFTIEGGQNNSFYVSDEPYGGYAKLEPDEQKQVTVYAPKANLADTYSERLCIWEGMEVEMADKYSSFEDFRQKLHLECARDGAGEIRAISFTPTNTTPPLLYGNSYGNYAMGFKIHVADELPADIPDFHEQPFQFDAWTHSVNGASSLDPTRFLGPLICSLLLLINTLL